MLFEPGWAIGGAAGVGAPLTRRLLSNDILPVCREATHGRRPDVAALDEAWKEVLGMGQQHLNLARRYFSLTLDDVDLAWAVSTYIRIRIGDPCQTRSMAFKVYRHGQTPVQRFGDEDRFEILEGGVLKIRRQHGTNLYINAALWASIEETPAPSVYASPGHSSDDGVPPEEQPF